MEGRHIMNLKFSLLVPLLFLVAAAFFYINDVRKFPTSEPNVAPENNRSDGSIPAHAMSPQQRFELCRSVMENRPHDPSKDGPYAKPTNSIGYGAYPPPEQQGIWINLKCWEIKDIYQPF